MTNEGSGTLGDMAGLLGAISDGIIHPYESRAIIEKHEGPIRVSTIWADDVGQFETALLDANGTYPVERYNEQDQAVAGHERWIVFADTGDGQVITQLGYGSSIDPESITLVAGERS